MSFVTVKVAINQGQIVALEPEMLPEKADGLLTILVPQVPGANGTFDARQRVDLPLIRGDGKSVINPTAEELDASAWGD